MTSEVSKYLDTYVDAADFLDQVSAQIFHALQTSSDSTFVHRHLLGNKFAAPAYALYEGRTTKEEFLQAVEYVNSFLRAYRLAEINADSLNGYYPWLADQLS